MEAAPEHYVWLDTYRTWTHKELVEHAAKHNVPPEITFTELNSSPEIIIGLLIAARVPPEVNSDG